MVKHWLSFKRKIEGQFLILRKPFLSSTRKNTKYIKQCIKCFALGEKEIKKENPTL